MTKVIGTTVGTGDAVAAGGLGEHERTRLEREVETHERRIDELVYRLYGLSEADIRIVEEATPTQRSR